MQPLDSTLAEHGLSLYRRRTQGGRESLRVLGSRRTLSGGLLVRRMRECFRLRGLGHGERLRVSHLRQRLRLTASATAATACAKAVMCALADCASAAASAKKSMRTRGCLCTCTCSERVEAMARVLRKVEAEPGGAE